MLRIRKNAEGIEIAVTMTRVVTDRVEGETEKDAVENAAGLVHDAVEDGFETLLAVYEKFDEVKIDKDGALHCRNKAPEVDDKSKDKK